MFAKHRDKFANGAARRSPSGAAGNQCRTILRLSTGVSGLSCLTQAALANPLLCCQHVGYARRIRNRSRIGSNNHIDCHSHSDSSGSREPSRR